MTAPRGTGPVRDRSDTLVASMTRYATLDHRRVDPAAAPTGTFRGRSRGGSHPRRPVTLPKLSFLEEKETAE